MLFQRSQKYLEDASGLGEPEFRSSRADRTSFESPSDPAGRRVKDEKMADGSVDDNLMLVLVGG